MNRPIAGALCAAVGAFLLVFAREWHRWALAAQAHHAAGFVLVASLALGVALVGTGVWLMFGPGKASGAS